LTNARHRLTRILRNKFISGLLILVPILLTAKALVWLFTSVDELAQPIAIGFFGRAIPGVGFVTTVAIVFVTGLLFSRGPLRSLLAGVEGLLDMVPLVGPVYGTTKKVLAGFGGGDSASAFQRFVLARLPGGTRPAFLMGSFTLASRDGSRRTHATVYVPTNHLYLGELFVVPVEDVVETDLSVEDGVSLILSAGASAPQTVEER
jgi:uncharacterized membrane protein